jgi:hypothetical protein
MGKSAALKCWPQVAVRCAILFLAWVILRQYEFGAALGYATVIYSLSRIWRWPSYRTAYDKSDGNPRMKP